MWSSGLVSSSRSASLSEHRDGVTDIEGHCVLDPPGREGGGYDCEKEGGDGADTVLVLLVH